MTKLPLKNSLYIPFVAGLLIGSISLLTLNVGISKRDIDIQAFSYMGLLLSVSLLLLRKIAFHIKRKQVNEQ